MSVIKLKRDKYRSERGGNAKLVDVICVKCNSKVLLYQKDGPGWLKRCYLNRIFWPEEYSRLQDDKSIDAPEKMHRLLCPNCKNLIGLPMRHKDKRLAFALIRGSFKRIQNKNVEYID